MTQLEKRFLKEGFSPHEIERIMAVIAGCSYQVYAVAQQIYAEWDMDFRYASNQKIELAALKRMMRLYEASELTVLARSVKLHSIVNLESVASNYVVRPTFSPEFEIKEGWKYFDPSSRFAKEAAYIAFCEQQTNV